LEFTLVVAEVALREFTELSVDRAVIPFYSLIPRRELIPVVAVVLAQLRQEVYRRVLPEVTAERAEAVAVVLLA